MQRKISILFLINVLFISFGLSQKITRVELLGAKSIQFDQNTVGGARRLIGDVKLRQEDVTMYCDSAQLFESDNTFNAFSKVHVTRGGEQKFDVYSNFLKHQGNEKIASFSDNVVMTDGKMTLRTDFFKYNLKSEIGEYTTGGTIVDSATTLISKTGFYYGMEKKFIFSKDVEINNPSEKFSLYTDTLHYMGESKTTYFFGPTLIINDTNYMSANYGWYNTKTNRAYFAKKARYHNASQTFTAREMNIDRNKKEVEAFHQAVFTDTANKVVAKANKVYYIDNPHKMLLTDSAVAIYVQNRDSLFMHADTLLSVPDTGGVHKVAKAFHHVKLFHKDFQAKCDSMSFTQSDSILKMFGNPVLWNQENQISAEYMELRMVDGKPSTFYLTNTAIIVSQVDSTRFNQISGKRMKGYIRKNELYKVDVFSNAESVYHALDKNGVLGVNMAGSTDMTIYIKNKKIERVVLLNAPSGAMKPPVKLSQKETRLKNFVWYPMHRPLKPLDIFKWN